MLSLDDEKAKDLADVMGNKTSKKILTLLANQEKSESDIAKELNQPINTIEYNLKKLVNAGLIEKSKDFFWSVKGKKIPVYKLSNKYIVIMPKQKSNLKIFLPLIAVLGLTTLGINYLSNKTALIANNAPQILKASESATSGASMGKPLTDAMIASANPSILNWFLSTPWAIFIAGSVLAIATYFIIKKIVRR